jgi:hypothetical protein
LARVNGRYAGPATAPATATVPGTGGGFELPPRTVVSSASVSSRIAGRFARCGLATLSGGVVALVVDVDVVDVVATLDVATLAPISSVSAWPTSSCLAPWILASPLNASPMMVRSRIPDELCSENGSLSYRRRQLLIV